MDRFYLRVTFLKSSNCRTSCPSLMCRSIASEESLSLCWNTSSPGLLLPHPLMRQCCVVRVLVFQTLCCYTSTSVGHLREVQPILSCPSGNMMPTSLKGANHSYHSGLYDRDLKSNYKLLNYSINFGSFYTHFRSSSNCDNCYAYSDLI